MYSRKSCEYLLDSGCFLNLVAGEPEVVFGHFYPADPNAGGGVGRCGCDDVLEQDIIILVS